MWISSEFFITANPLLIAVLSSKYRQLISSDVCNSCCLAQLECRVCLSPSRIPINKLNQVIHNKLPYILESNPHPFYSFRGLKNQTGIRIAVVSWILEKW